MISEKKVIAWIPARGGSKGIKKKNIYLLNGKPLIAYTIEAALGSQYVDRVMVSTDSEEIAKLACKYGAWVPSLRPDYLAEDTSKTIDAVMYSLELLNDLNVPADVFCLLQPTSPLRDASDIDKALELFDTRKKSVAAVSEVRDHPLLIRTVSPEGDAVPLLKENSTCRRQDMPKYYRVNGSIYINNISEINANTSFNDNSVAYIMESTHGIDIDDMADMLLAEYYLDAYAKDNISNKRS